MIPDFPKSEFDRLHEFVAFGFATEIQARRLANLVDKARVGLNLSAETFCDGITSDSHLLHDAEPLLPIEEKTLAEFGVTIPIYDHPIARLLSDADLDQLASKIQVLLT